MTAKINIGIQAVYPTDHNSCNPYYSGQKGLSIEDFIRVIILITNSACIKACLFQSIKAMMQNKQGTIM